MPIFYAGVGPRDAPNQILDVAANKARLLRSKGLWLRSGGARGMDKAFEYGAGDRKEILDATDATTEAIDLASKYHPAWDKCDDYAQKLHGRNAMIMLGKDLRHPVDFVLTWTMNEEAGGTGLGLKIAKDNNIDVFNIWHDGEHQLQKWLRRNR